MPPNPLEMLLAVDIGNTKIKAAVFKDTALQEKFILDKNSPADGLKKIFNSYPNIIQGILSSVGNDDENLLATLKNNTQLILVNRDFAFPFKNNYATPATLGIDRMVLAAGAVLQYPGQNRLVIDAGTCITYDFIDANDVYQGGAISPGPRLQYAAMHNFTAKLPLLSLKMPEHYTGKSTDEAMHSGVVYGLLHEIEGFIAQYKKEHSNLKIILTGGDAEFLAKRFKNTIFANSNFLLESLNQLYLYSIKND